MKHPHPLFTFRKHYGFNSSNVFTFGSNPKVNKNDKVGIPTAVFHLLPMYGGVCPNAGTCKTVCLHGAGNPAYMKGKQAARPRRSRAWLNHPAQLKQLLVLEFARWSHKQSGELGCRLNGTSDIRWESEWVDVTATMSIWLRQFGINLTPGLYEFLSAMQAVSGNRTQFYDYTKRCDRSVDLCRSFGYHLTYSWGSTADTATQALTDRRNLAVPFKRKRSEPLPPTVTIDGRIWRVIDGDVTDARFLDPDDDSYVIGLRYKRVPNQPQSAVDAFCFPE